MKILLSTPPGKTTELWPPLGLLYIASCLRSQRGDDVSVIDAFCENLTEEQLISRVMAKRPDVFGMNCSTHTFLDTIHVLERVRELLPDTVLVLGGYHATFTAERILREYPFVDFVLKGEAEYSLPRLLDCLEQGAKPVDVDGISFIDDGRLIDLPFRLIEDLDSLPFPDRNLALNVEYGYFFGNIRLTFGKFTTMCTSRGCPYSCTYCSCAAFSLRKWRARSAENVVDELELLYGDGYECCVFVDDNITQRRSRIEKICELIRSRRIKMQFYCEGRADSASYSLLRTMKRAGFNVIYFGVESASQHVLDYYNKRTKVDQARKAIENAKRAKMLAVSSYIFGAPVESREDIQQTINFIEQAKPHGIQVNILDCLVGTPIWEDLTSEGIVGEDDWKTNHRIYEYLDNGLSKQNLEDLVDESYRSYLRSWKKVQSIAQFGRILLSNSTARRVVLGNVLNPEARRKISEGLDVPKSK